MKTTWFQKYGTSLKMILPFRIGKDEDDYELADEKIGCTSYFSLNWMNSYMWQTRKTQLNETQIKKLKERVGVAINAKKMKLLWDEEVHQKGKLKASLFRTICKFNILRFVFTTIFIYCMGICNYVGPTWVLNKMLQCLEDPMIPSFKGIIWAAVFSVTQLFKHIMFNTYWVTSAYTGFKTIAALQGRVYKKILKAKTSGDINEAEIVNHVTSDMERIYQLIQTMLLASPPPFITVTHIVFCYLFLGPWSLLGNTIMLLYAPFTLLVIKIASKHRRKASTMSDQRIDILNQLLVNIKFIKMTVWENIFCTLIKDSRSGEAKFLGKAIFLQSISWSTVVIAGNLAFMLAATGYLLNGGILETIQILNLMSAFAALTTPLGTVVLAVKAISEGLISCQRIQKFLISDDIEESILITSTDNRSSVIIKNLDVVWISQRNHATKSTKFSSDAKSKISSTKTIQGVTNESFLFTEEESLKRQVVLDQVNLTIKRGQLVGICGSVGSGKSTLLSTICGSTTIANGNVNVNGSVALVTQQAWMFIGTVKQNILFGQQFDDQWYREVISACCLEKDLELLAKGDETEIGERGSNLSGGQKQRINLARALYSNRDIYLLDDPLSAIDAKVAQHIFQECIQKYLRHKTVLLVTHFPHYLQLCDYIVVLHQGNVIEQGTHSLLMNNSNKYTQMVNKNLRDNQKQKDHNKHLENQRIAFFSSNNNDSFDGKMIKAEIDLKSTFSIQTICYFARQYGGWCASLLLLLSVLLFGAVAVLNNVWLKIWLTSNKNQQNSTLTNSTSMFINNQDPYFSTNFTVYVCTMIALFLIALLKAILLKKTVLNGNSSLHNQMLKRVVRSPMSFFDSNPIGRIVNRFSRDMDELDVHVPSLGEYVSQTLIIVMFQTIVVCTLYPWFTLALIFITTLLVTLDKLFSPAVQEFKRMDNLLKPPVINHLNTTIHGLQVIKCYNQQKLFNQLFEELVNKHLSACLQYQLSTKWIAFRVDIIGWLAITVLALLITSTKNSMSTINGGLSLVLVIQICITLSVAMRFKAELLAKLSSMKRIGDYITILKEETSTTTHPALSTWPTNGKVEFQNVSMKYGDDSPTILNDLNVTVAGGEKVGIVGRTGAGKSSIFSALMRLTEIQAGRILIDDVDISTKSLDELRSKMAVIPQEPVILNGTVRWNLDPTNIYSDEQIWDSLEKSYLKTKIQKAPSQLHTPINSDSGMFSFGEKQLFSLARALLKNSKILLLDEATSNVDLETDQLIQKSIRQHCNSCTVFTIAHRLNTIVDYDKIMTIESGKVIEYNAPKCLLTTNSQFRAMFDAQT